MKKMIFVSVLLMFFAFAGKSDPDYIIQGATDENVGDQEVYTIIPAPVGACTWTVTGGDIIAGQGTSSIIVNWTSAGANQVAAVPDNGAIVIIDDNSW